MTAAELASFRALLQGQAAAPPGSDKGLFARMRARLTVVEGGLKAAPPGLQVPPAAAAAPMEPDWAAEAWAETPADPPPSRPPAFGRRDALPAAPDACARPPATASRAGGEDRVRLAPRCDSEAASSTPDDRDGRRGCTGADPAPSSPAAVTTGPAPGVIAGWSRAKPPGARVRLLGRLEAVLLAEREGLDARRASGG